jgi:hypothetical protein
MLPPNPLKGEYVPVFLYTTNFFEYAIGVTTPIVVIIKITFGRSFIKRKGIRVLQNGIPGSTDRLTAGEKG